MALLTVKNLGINFGGLKAVDDFSVNIEKGMLIWIYGLIYPVVRFINEFFRGDAEERGYFGALSTSQWISIFVFALSAFMVTKIILKRKRSDML